MTQSAWFDVIDGALDDVAALRSAVEAELRPEDARAWARGDLTPDVDGLQRALSQRFRGRWPGTFHLDLDDGGAPRVHLIGLTDADVRKTSHALRRARRHGSGPLGRLLRFFDTLLP